MSFFKDRKDAGIRLADEITDITGDALVLGVARGGIPVAYEIAKKLQRELNVFIVRKIGAPGKEELGIGAVAEGGVRVFDLLLIDHLGVPTEMIIPILKMEEQELYRRIHAYRDNEPLVLRNKTVILVDDGIATGISLLAAIRSIRKQTSKKIIIAAPVASDEAIELLESEADALIRIVSASYFSAVGAWYETFPQVSDEDVLHTLHLAKSLKSEKAHSSHRYHS